MYCDVGPTNEPTTMPTVLSTKEGGSSVGGIIGLILGLIIVGILCYVGYKSYSKRKKNTMENTQYLDLGSMNTGSEPYRIM